MFSIVIIAGEAPGPLVATFRALMPGVLAGIVSDVAVVAPEPEPLAEICDGAGARLVQRGEDALREGRGNWVVILEAGARLQEGWPDAVLGHVLAGSGPAAFEAPRPASLWRRLFGAVGRPLRAGFLVERETALAIIRTTSLERLPVGRAAARLPVGLLPPAE